GRASSRPPPGTRAPTPSPAQAAGRPVPAHAARRSRPDLGRRQSWSERCRPLLASFRTMRDYALFPANRRSAAPSRSSEKPPTVISARSRPVNGSAPCFFAAGSFAPATPLDGELIFFLIAGATEVAGLYPWITASCRARCRSALE